MDSAFHHQFQFCNPLLELANKAKKLITVYQNCLTMKIILSLLYLL